MLLYCQRWRLHRWLFWLPVYFDRKPIYERLSMLGLHIRVSNGDKTKPKLAQRFVRVNQVIGRTVMTGNNLIVAQLGQNHFR
jgi:hypothetical protein